MVKVDNADGNLSVFRLNDGRPHPVLAFNDVDFDDACRLAATSENMSRCQPNCGTSGSNRSQTRDNRFQHIRHFPGRALKRGVLDRGHRCDGIDCSHLDFAIAEILNHDVAGQHGADLVLDLQRVARNDRIACPQNPVVPIVDAELLPEGVFDVDFRDNAEASLLEGVCDALYDFIERAMKRFGEILAHGRSPALS